MKDVVFVAGWRCLVSSRSVIARFGIRRRVYILTFDRCPVSCRLGRGQLSAESIVVYG